MTAKKRALNNMEYLSPVSRERESRSRHTFHGATLGNRPDHDLAVLCGRGNHMVIKRIKIRVKDRCRVAIVHGQRVAHFPSVSMGNHSKGSTCPPTLTRRSHQGHHGRTTTGLQVNRHKEGICLDQVGVPCRARDF